MERSDSMHAHGALLPHLPRRVVLGGLGALGVSLAAGACQASTLLPRIGWPRLRGTSFETHTGVPIPAMARQMAAWNMNVVRINFGSDAFAADGKDDAGPPADGEDPLAPYAANVSRIRAFTQECARHGIGVILAADQIYGRRLDYFTERGGDDFSAGLKDNLCRFWSAMAAAFSGDPAIIAYDMLNEPNYAGSNPFWSSPSAWQDNVLPAAIAAVRSHDPTIPVIVMPWPWGLPGGFGKQKTIDDPHVVYSFHSYAPFRFTHQGVTAKAPPRGSIAWPGTIAEYDRSVPKRWDKDAYVAYIRPALDFRERTGARMLVGEWGCVRWARNRDRYVQDVLDILERENLDWLYHSYGSWSGWNPTYEPTFKGMASRAEIDGGFVSGAHRALLTAFARNTALSLPFR